MFRSSHLKNFIISILGLTVLSGCSKKSTVSPERQKEVVVYTYDSFVSEWGPASALEELFEVQTGLDLTFVNCGDGVQLMSRAILEKDDVQADIVLGLDNNLASKAIESGIFEPYQPDAAEELIPADVVAQLGSDWSLTPFDYSHFAFVYDTKSDVPCPESLDDLLKPVYKNKIILMDPRTSTPGLGFVSWTVAVYGDKVGEYWKALKPNILTMASGWSAGYGLFKKGEAPLVISYTTSPASHIEYDNTDRYIAPVFAQGHSIQVEGAGILKDAPNPEGAKVFMNFLIGDAAQSTIPLTQWMNPVNKNVDLPASYKKGAPVPAVTLSADPDLTEKAVETVMKILED